MTDNHRLEGRRVAILATDGFEQSELEQPLEALREAGAAVDVVSLQKADIKGWKHDDWGEAVAVDVTIDAAREHDYDALVLPGGLMNPDALRMDERAVRFVREFADDHKPIAAICHGPWTLVEADAVRNRRMTSYPSIATDLQNAGAEWVDEEVVVDGNLVTSRKPDDLPAFCRRMIEVIASAPARAA